VEHPAVAAALVASHLGFLFQHEEVEAGSFGEESRPVARPMIPPPMMMMSWATLGG
jgi:hypothetical protein